MSRLLIWTGEQGWAGGWRTEAARVEFADGGLRATGTQLALDPVPYRLEYRLDAEGEGFVTRSLRVEAGGDGWERRLRLERDPGGEWTAEVGGEGELDLPAPGGDTSRLSEALDCDLGLSPLTNSMPVLRHRLHREPGNVDFVMAWVSVPELEVHAMAQRYGHLGEGEGGAGTSEGGAMVRYASVEDGEEIFTAELELDHDGLVRHYPGLARRLSPNAN
ncbi:MAG: putative glycolipid-binding domain-containing protein [Solirubrobacterales bacterium]